MHITDLEGCLCSLPKAKPLTARAARLLKTIKLSSVRRDLLHSKAVPLQTQRGVAQEDNMPQSALERVNRTDHSHAIQESKTQTSNAMEGQEIKDALGLVWKARKADKGKKKHKKETKDKAKKDKAKRGRRHPRQSLCFLLSFLQWKTVTFEKL